MIAAMLKGNSQSSQLCDAALEADLLGKRHYGIRLSNEVEL